jgi:hypothetical protein
MWGREAMTTSRMLPARHDVGEEATGLLPYSSGSVLPVGGPVESEEAQGSRNRLRRMIHPGS